MGLGGHERRRGWAGSPGFSTPHREDVLCNYRPAQPCTEKSTSTAVPAALAHWGLHVTFWSLLQHFRLSSPLYLLRSGINEL